MEHAKNRKIYKNVKDLLHYLNQTKMFKEKITEEILYDVFMRANLFCLDNKDYSIKPTTFFRNSGGCFTAKNGRILFSDALWNLMTTDNSDYTAKEWLGWFKYMLNSNKNCNLEKLHNKKVVMDETIASGKHKYKVKFNNGETHYWTVQTAKIAKLCAIKKYGDCIKSVSKVF